jgi:L-alanine-DL-glutamate epimerase-like enolase superfamily enzyme
LGLGALIQVSATLPNNFIAFEYTTADPDWWNDIVDTVPVVENGMIAVPDKPGMGINIVPEKAQRYLASDDHDFFA